MPAKRQVYLLDPQKLRPETIAVTFAKTSRSPLSFQEIAAELTDEKSSEFHEKWVVGYGHASVAEHAVLHIAVENISRLAVECLEGNRLASFTEKSTRYQKWSSEEFFIPAEFKDTSLQETYLSTCKHLFETYQAIIPRLQEVIAVRFPQRSGESEATWERRVRSEIVDSARFLLPAAALANVGVTINARALEHAICKMLSHPLQEVRDLGEEMKKVSQEETPTLIKYANANPYLVSTCQKLTDSARSAETSAPTQEDWCQLVHFDTDGEDRLMASALYRFGTLSYTQSLARIQAFSPQERAQFAALLLGSLDCHDTPLRELEHSSYTFDLTLDQGAYFELKRHRMMTQTPQLLTADLGYAVPELITAAGAEPAYREAMENARSSWQKLADSNPDAAAYVVPNGFNRRVLLTMNLRSAAHFIRLRSAPNAHFSIRRAAQRIADLIQNTTPLLAQYLQHYPEESWESIEARYFHEA